MPKSSELTSQQNTAIDVLVAGGSNLEAAEQSGVNRRSLQRWLNLPEFRKELFDRRSYTFSQATGLLSSSARDAVQVLKDIMQDSKAPMQHRLTAARSVLEFGFRGVELEAVKTRIEEFEQQIETLTARIENVGEN
jgi:hypothetical protein